MDLKDKKILTLLDENARLHSSKISRIIKTSRQVVDYRIQQLINKGILINCITLLEPFNFVDNIWHTYIKLHSLTQETEKELLRYLESQKKVWWIAECQGEWDIIFSTASSSINELDSILQDLRSKYSKNIASEQTTTLISAINFPRGYFTNKPTKQQTFVRQEQKSQVDTTDIGILKTLATNARLSATKIANELNLTARQVMYRIKTLEKNGVIRAYKTQLNLEKINYNYYKVCFYTQQYTKKIENKILTWCEINPYTICFIKKIAPWTFEIEFELPSYNELNKTLNEIRNVFGDVIKRTEIIIIIKEFKGELDILKTK